MGTPLSPTYIPYSYMDPLGDSICSRWKYPKYKNPKTSGKAMRGLFGVSQNSEYLFGGYCYKDYSILGSILGSPYLGKLLFLM